MSDGVSISILATLCLGVLAAIFTAVLRVGGIGARSVGPGGYRGTAIVGGIVAGLLAGPSILGNVAPETHRDAFVGGGAEIEALRETMVRQRADLAALRAMGVTEVAAEELAAEHGAELEPLRAAVEGAERARRGVFDWIAVGLAGVCVFAGGANMGRGAIRRGIALGRSAIGGLVAHFVGVWVPGLVFVGFGVGDLGGSFAFALMIGAYGMAGALRGLDRGVAGFAFGLMVLLLFQVAGGSGMSWLAVVLVSGFLASWLRGRMIRRGALAVMRWVALPALAAVLAVRVDVAALGTHTNFWFLFVAAVLWCSDGRWFAAKVGLRVAGEKDASWARASKLVNTGTGTVALVLTALFAHAGIAGEAFIASALASAAVVELFRGFREFSGPVLDGRH